MLAWNGILLPKSEHRLFSRLPQTKSPPTTGSAATGRTDQSQPNAGSGQKVVERDAEAVERPGHEVGLADVLKRLSVGSSVELALDQPPTKAGMTVTLP